MGLNYEISSAGFLLLWVYCDSDSWRLVGGQIWRKTRARLCITDKRLIDCSHASQCKNKCTSGLCCSGSDRFNAGILLYILTVMHEFTPLKEP